MNAHVFCLMLVLSLTGCRTPPVGPDGPPPIDPGRTASYPDGRIIEDARYAALLIAPGGEERFYDDIGRMVARGDAGGAESIWVYDYDSAGPIAAEDAHYVASPKLVTPRGSGLLAVATAERAEALAREYGGRVLGWPELAPYLAAAAGPDGWSQPLPSTDLSDVLEADGTK